MTKKVRKVSGKTRSHSKSIKKHGTHKPTGPKESSSKKATLKIALTHVAAVRAVAVTKKPPSPPGESISINRIGRETVLGDLIVAFPWTRVVFEKYGLRLEVEEAGDIYMSVEAFAALRNLKPESLIRELVDVSKQSPLPPQPVTPLVAPTA